MKKIALATAATLLFAGAASAADLAARPYTKAPVPVLAVYNWTGFYIGANVGYGWGNADTFFNPLPNAVAFANLAPTTLSPDPQGAFAGGQAGYNWQAGKFVLGVETDIQWSDINRTVVSAPIIQNNGAPFNGFLAAGQKIDWFGTTRLRAGLTATDRLLLYVTGGVAYGDVNYAAQSDFRPQGTIQYPAGFKETKVGWTVGAGAEWAFADNWSAKVEYLYMDLGNSSVVANPVPANPPFQVGYTWKTTENLARFGINYRFGGPVVARY